MMKVVVGLFATAVVGLGGYTFYQYSNGNLSEGCQSTCSAAKISSCCDAGEVAMTEESSCCASLSRVSDKPSCCAPASPCCAPGSACCKDDSSKNATEVLAVMPREVK